MNKKRVDAFIERARKALIDTQIVDLNGTIKKGYRGQISTFGTAIHNGSVKSAVAFFVNEDNSAAVDRCKLMPAICYVIDFNTQNKKASDYKILDLYNYLDKNDPKATKENIIDAALALKLAMNLFNLEK